MKHVFWLREVIRDDGSSLLTQNRIEGKKKNHEAIRDGESDLTELDSDSDPYPPPCHFTGLP